MFSTSGEEPGLARKEKKKKNERGVFHWLGSAWPQSFAWLVELILSLSVSFR